ncbi:hypothetical protein N8755_05450 [Alphaproteobacteria bacterium]|nr:hypothetical protein [Alphaproteobacteria bacterium]
MNITVPYGCCLAFTISVFGLSGCNPHVTALRHEPAPTEYFTIVAHEQLSQNLDQMLQTRINHLVADHQDIDLPDTMPDKMTDKMTGIMPDIMANQMDVMNIYQFTTDGQMRLTCEGSICDGAIFDGAVIIDIDRNVQQISIDHIRLQDQSLLFTLNGQITKRFGAVETILNPANVDMRLITPNADITLDQSGILGIYDLPSYDDLPLSDNIAVELSHQHSQTYFTGQVIPDK